MALEGYVDVRPCPFCHNDNLQQYKTVTSPPTHVVEFCGGPLLVRTLVTYLECKTCGLIVQSPRMTDERLEQYYASGLYRATIGAKQEDLDYSERQRQERIAAWLKSQGIKPASHADIGSSRGYLLDLVGAPVAHGFDQNRNYYTTGQLVPEKNQLGTYELVTAIHVLEHTPDPQAELAWYRSLSTDKVLVEVPHPGAPLRFPHLFYFPPQILVEMVKRAGMRVLRMETDDVTRILAQVLQR